MRSRLKDQKFAHGRLVQMTIFCKENLFNYKIIVEIDRSIFVISKSKLFKGVRYAKHIYFDLRPGSIYLEVSFSKVMNQIFFIY